MRVKFSMKYLVPNFFTALSMVSALVALNFIAEKEFVLSCFLVAFSMVCDYLDGKVARLLDASSRFGMQLDVLSDFLAFGVVPVFLVYRVSLQYLGLFGVLACVGYVLAGAYRLVRFSFKNPVAKIKFAFEGLPIPAAAGLVVSYTFFSLKIQEAAPNEWIFLVIIVILSVLMVSKIEYLAIENKGKFLKCALSFFIILLITIVISIRISFIFFLVLIALYIFFGFIRHFYIKYK